jgi:hypothetical protein
MRIFAIVITISFVISGFSILVLSLGNYSRWSQEESDCREKWIRRMLWIGVPSMLAIWVMGAFQL